MSILLLGRKVKIFLDGGNPCVRIADQQMKKTAGKRGNNARECYFKRKKQKSHNFTEWRESELEL